MARAIHAGSPGRPFLPLVRAGALGPFIEFMQTTGIPVERHLAAARCLSTGIPVERHLAAARVMSHAVEVPESLIPLRPVLEFFDQAATTEGSEDFGLLVGARTEIDALGAFGRAILRSVTVGDAIRSAAENMRFYNSAERICLLCEDDRVLICHSLNACESAGVRHGHLFAIMLLIKIIRLAAGQGWWPREIRLPASETKWRKQYEAIVPAHWVPHANHYVALVVDRSLLGQQLIQGMHGRKPTAVVSPTLALNDHGKRDEGGSDDVAFLRSTAPADDLGRSVEQAISGLLPGGYPDIRLAAELAGLSVRTLSRRLAEEGTSYERLVERRRFEAAIGLLRDGHLRLIDISYELGYADPANFSRAFKRWTGMPPSEYRYLCEMGTIVTPVESGRATLPSRIQASCNL